MIKCANCSKDAVFQYNVTADFVLYYCVTDLPKFLKGKTAEASLKTLVVQPAPTTTTTSKKKKAPAPVIEESSEEE